MMKTLLPTKIGEYLKDLLFPRLCTVCGKRLCVSEKVLCVDCLHHLPRTEYHLQRGNPCEQIFYHRVKGLQQAAAYFYYERDNKYKNILWNLKYRGQTEIGRVMGCIMAEEIRLTSSFFEGIDVIIPVPLSKQKQKKRGYNQCNFIVEGISGKTGIPVGKQYLLRTIDNESQTHKTRLERQENVEHIFEVRHGEELKGKHILLVDDVLTTGATLLSCASALAKIENTRFSFLTLACTKF